MLNTSDFKRNLVIELDGKPWQIVDVSFNTPSARGASTIVKTRLKCLLDGTVVDKPFRGGDRVPEPDFQRRDCQYLYTDDRFGYFMDLETFDQFEIALDDLKDTLPYLYDGIEGTKAMVWNGSAIAITLPSHVELEIVQTDPPLKGATAAAQTKRAELSTGLVVQVPMYIDTGETVRVDTRTGDYLQRVN